MEKYQLTIYSPYRKFFDEKITSLIVPTNDGLLGILAHHTPMAATLKEGVMEVQRENQGRAYFAISKGVLEVNSSSEVLLLIDRAVKIENKNIDKSRISELVNF